MSSPVKAKASREKYKKKARKASRTQIMSLTKISCQGKWKAIEGFKL